MLTGIVLGLIVGASFGYVAFAIMHAGKESDERVIK